MTSFVANEESLCRAGARPNNLRLVTCILLCVFVLAGGAFANTIAVYNTGQATLGGNAIATGLTDPHYTLISAPMGVTLQAITSTAHPAWIANQTTADWINPTGTGTSNLPPGNYDYETTFDLTGLVPGTAKLSGNWATDNNSCIYLNGVNTGQCTAFAAFGGLTAFSITSGFQAGVNTLEFKVTNGATTNNPTGLLVEIAGTASPVPEPSSLMLLGTGLAGFAGMIRRWFST